MEKEQKYVQGMLGRKLVSPIVLVAVTIVALYFPTFESLHRKWVAWSEFYAHGYIIVVAIFYVLWEQRWRLGGVITGPNRLWLLPLAGMSFVWLMAYVIQVMVVQQLLLPAIYVCALGAILGSRFVWVSAPVMVVFYTVIPFWEILNSTLQDLTVWVNSHLIALSNITALLEGNRIVMPSGVIEIASGCSGLSYFVVSISLAAIYGNLDLRSARSRLILLAVAITLGLLTNWVRVFALILIGYFSEMQSSLVTDHLMFGWYIYLAVVLSLIVLTHFLKKNELKRLGVAEQWTAENKDVVSALSGQRLSVGHILMLGITLSVGPFLALVLQQSEGAISDHTVEDVRGWTLLPLKPRQWYPVFVSADWQYHQNAESRGQFVSMHGIAYARQSQGRELISTRNKIVDGDVWRIVGDSEVVPVGGDSVKQLQISNGSQKRVVWYWYRVGGVTVLTDINAKLQQIRGVFVGRSEAAFVALSVACDRTCEGVEESLSSAYPELSVILNHAVDSGFE
ncbi:exosortase C-terminal domain/associated protein EpsI [Oceanicoccus sp. KOV_DT_Chl]|uniref:exosortase C-terminal domain/associated protein EpsI n=1 Tax=Oceanicoccus sp. KOV_DT_Chl TaxID=1904639 RepID=UPI00135A8C96|nr:exosortase C-terminal domain/associated protein EpsI [Oceanicoccus sp. KOV_DT_Chl]